jgi:hypothetical protein
MPCLREGCNYRSFKRGSKCLGSGEGCPVAAVVDKLENVDKQAQTLTIKEAQPCVIQ